MKVDDFTVELVRADTKEAFKEHTSPSNGQVFAEVEPGVDYLIRIETSRRSGASAHELKVDGVRLGYIQYLSQPGNGYYIGSWERKDGITKMTALRFNLASGGVKGEGGPPTMLTGNVEISFHELGKISEKKVVANDFSSTELTGGSSVGGKKCVMSSAGSFVEEEKKCATGGGQKMTTVREKGKFLRTVTLHYCTAVGLIVNKILAPPPVPESEDTKPRVKREKKRKAAVDLTEDDSDDSDDFGEI